MTKERLEEIEKETPYVGNSARERELTAEIRRCWAEIEELKKSQGGVYPPPFDDDCLYMAGIPEV